MSLLSFKVYLLMAIILSSYCSVEATTVTKASVLQDANMTDPTIFESKFWLIEFYAPWCSYCRKLGPVLDEIASEIADDNYLSIGKIDATVQKEAALTYGVKGYPTLIYFKDGIHRIYDGSRDKAALLAFMQKAKTASIIAASTTGSAHAHDDLHLLLGINETFAFLLTLPAGPTSEITEMWRTAFEKVAARYHLHVPFMVHSFREQSSETAASSEPASAQENGINKGVPDKVELVGSSSHSNSIPSVCKVEKGRRSLHMSTPKLQQPMSLTNAIDGFVRTNNHPSIVHFDRDNFKRLASLGRVLILAVIDYGDVTRTAVMINALHKVSHHTLSSTDYVIEDIDNHFLYGHVDGVRWREFFQPYGVAKQLPCFLLLDFRSHVDRYHVVVVNNGVRVLDPEMTFSLLQKAVTDVLLEKTVPLIDLVKKGYVDMILTKMQRYAPWSWLFVVVTLVVCALSFFVLSFPDDDKERAEKKKK